ncbi:MAG: hypothetical protein CL675_03210 [Bdellovibrionaceae bacterium]|nr:hypothetical protein [Pseudobdellovibrionaceae bacterium]
MDSDYLKGMLRLGLIAFSVVFVSMIVVVALRFVGLSRPYKAFQHHLTAETTYQLGKTDSEAGLLVLRVEKDKEGQWVAVEADSTKRPLESRLEELSQRPGWVIYLSETQPLQLDGLTELLDQIDPSNFVVISPYSKPVTALQKKRPRWLFGLPPTELVKWHMMSVIFLEPFIQLSADWVVFTKQDLDDKLIDPRLTKEMQRRQMKLVYAGSKTELPEWLIESVTGYWQNYKDYAPPKR